MSLIYLENLSKSFGVKKVLEDINLVIDEGELICISGASGSGKSTLLNILGLLDSYDTGAYYLNGIESPKPYSRNATKVLKNDVGYLFQNFALIDHKSVEYNLKLARTKESHYTIESALARVGLSGFEKKKIYHCSGGEQQRIAIARLLVKNSNIILCDEPTGSLDDINKENVMNLLIELNKEGKTVVIVSHDDYVMQKVHRVIEIETL
ncbi:ATP-binding cassette domain-containing protein [Erysipelothrix urinaevulpis]|uniref:ATP-binding cassette domain-containing protein n=1 Tax=Erysipelothrix urinaevulpis TaxID=2683717 RepID=UPI001358BB75|nr:ATP-binding cassette domain-containing protein [Erysipelothrix urinaevulpis]